MASRFDRVSKKVSLAWLLIGRTPLLQSYRDLQQTLVQFKRIYSVAVELSLPLHSEHT